MYNYLSTLRFYSKSKISLFLNLSLTIVGVILYLINDKFHTCIILCTDDTVIVLGWLCSVCRHFCVRTNNERFQSVYVYTKTFPSDFLPRVRSGTGA